MSTVQIRIHGRGGQGVVTAAELLSVAAFVEGRHAQAFPSFGSERTGAPIVAFCRIADTPIRTHEPIDSPDVVVVQDATLLHSVDLFAGLSPTGHLLINTKRTVEELGIASLRTRLPGVRITSVPATALALEHIGRPLPNAALLGGVAAATGIVSLASLVTAIEERFAPAVASGNVAAASAAFDAVQNEARSVTHAAAD